MIPLDPTDAACAQVDPDLFFPDKTEPWKLSYAMNVCATCPMLVECLNYALDNNETIGVWGGTSAIVRQRMKRDKSYKRIHLNNMSKRAEVLSNTNKGASK